MASYGMPPGMGRESVLGRVSAPAYAMMAIAGLGILQYLALIGLHVLGMGVGIAGAHGHSDDAVGALLGGTIGIIWGVVGILVNIVIVVGALSMARGGSYIFAWIATVLTFIPCFSGCCCAGVIVALWSGFVLADDQVRSAFA
jgi:hypothetical protein